MVKLDTPILEAILDENQNLALILPRVIAKEPQFELYFFRTQRRGGLHRTYDSELEEIPVGETVDFNFLGETGVGTGDDILTVWDERPFRIPHFAWGIRPGEIWWYKSIPADVPQTGWAYKIPPKVADKRDYIPGYLSPYDKPTVATECVLYQKLSTHIGLKNDAGRPIRPSLRLLGASYDTLPITDSRVVDKMIAGIIPCRFITVGGLRMFTYDVPEPWKGNEVTVDKATIERVLGGGR